jgi:hypothetical protein
LDNFSIKILGEAIDAGDYCLDGKFSKGTETFVLDLFGDSVQERNVVPGTLPLGNTLGEVLHPISAVPAGGALPAGFVLEEVDSFVDHPVHAE